MKGDLGQQEFGVNIHQLPVSVVQVALWRKTLLSSPEVADLLSLKSFSASSLPAYCSLLIGLARETLVTKELFVQARGQF